MGRRIGVAGLCVLGGCLMSNPDWDGAAEDSGATSLSPTTMAVDDGATPPGGGEPSAASAGATSGEDDPNRMTGSSGPGVDSGGPEPITVVLPATIAVCLSDQDLDPQECTPRAGVENLRLLSDGTEHVAIFFKFETDPEFEGFDATRVGLKLVAADPGSDLGSLYLAESFTTDTLALGFPEPTGRPLSSPKGPAAAGDDVWFGITDEIVEAGGSIYFGLYPGELSEMYYRGNVSRTPPVLVVSYAPR